MGQEEVKGRLGVSRVISERTARRWLAALLYRYGQQKKGMYVDGHERDDVVKYCQEVFLPVWAKMEKMMVLQDKDGDTIQLPVLPNFPIDLRIVLWTHDESTFYGHDQRKTQWVHSSEGPQPIRKGEGTSIMVSDFCSPELGWLCSRNWCVHPIPPNLPFSSQCS